LEIGESTVKRWCDRGLIPTVRTAGGHRKLPMAEVLRFLRDHNQQLMAPEVLGLPPVSEHAAHGLLRCRAELVEALLAGNETLARQITLNLYLAKHHLSVICDEVIAGAFHEIGDGWACNEVDVYQERRGCEIALRLLFELRKAQQTPDHTWPATGGTIEGDHYVLPCTMAELVLRDAAFDAISLGSSIPFPSLLCAVRTTRPKLFWLSVSHISNEREFLAQFAELSQECAAAGSALVVGGRALSEQLRQRMTYSAFGDNMQHLERFARTLRQAKAISVKNA
jgi:hypothetical protein